MWTDICLRNNCLLLTSFDFLNLSFISFFPIIIIIIIYL